MLYKTSFQLRQLYEQTKCPCPCSEQAIQDMFKIQKTSLNPSMQIQLSYYQGRILLRKKTPPIDILEQVNELFDHMFILSDSYRIPIEDIRYFFVSAKAKLDLAGVLGSLKEKRSLLKVASKMVERGLHADPQNHSLQWLSSQLMKQLNILRLI